MRTLAPKLLASAPPGDCAALDPEFIRASLTSLSAKAWLAEPNGFRNCTLCNGDWKSGPAHAQIRNGRWEHGESVAARDGRAAPYLTKIKVMGAFLSVELNEFVPSRKRRRHWEIHERGWS